MEKQGRNFPRFLSLLSYEEMNWNSYGYKEDLIDSQILISFIAESFLGAQASTSAWSWPTLKRHFEKNPTMGSILVASIIIFLVAAVAITVGVYTIFRDGSIKNPRTDSNTKNSSLVVTTMKELLGNFSQMRIDYVVNSSIPSQNVNASISYSLLGRPSINGTMLTEYDFTVSTYGDSGSQSSNSSLIYYNLQENVVLATIDGKNFTGANTAYASFLLLPFSIFLNFQKYFFENTSVFSNFVTVNSTAESFGNLTMPVTTYQGGNIHYENDIVQNMTVKVGQPLGRDYELTTFVSIQGATSGGTSQGGLIVNLISATESGT